MAKVLRFSCLSIGLLACLVCGARAQPPSPISPTLYGFPGVVPEPSSATSAGLALADHWLGDDDPSGNPAARASGFSISPALLHMSRQDLRADNLHMDEQGAFLDAAGGRIGVPVGRWDLSAYAYQPVLRLEDNAFQRGEAGGPTPPAIVQSSSTAREVRAGLGASLGLGVVRVGAAGEWSHREDEFVLKEQSGSPESGERRVSYSGNGVGLQAGVSLDLDRSRPGSFALGVSARYVPAITVKGDQRLTLLVGDSLGQVSAEREAGWEGGLSARVPLTRAFHLVGGFGGRTAQKWKGFDVTSGAGSSWSVGGELHNARDPWTLRLGGGRGEQQDVAEARYGTIAVGIGWRLESTVLDLGVLRRTLERSGHPTSYDDRVVGTITVAF